MFGMLDYRAHKLFLLVAMPFRVINRLMYFVFIAIAVGLAEWTKFGMPAKVAVGYVSFEGMFLVFGILWLFLVTLPVQKIFFWMIDVIPSRGADEEEAQEIVMKGKAVWLYKKLATEIENFTYKDTDELASTMNWRARLFFNGKEKLDKRVAALYEIYEQTGKQPGSFPDAEIKKMLGGLNPSWFEKVIVSPQAFNSIAACLIIIVAILYLNQ
jgi:hypothetical protein